MIETEISINNLLIGYLDNGNFEAEKTILFIHGNSMNASLFGYQLKDEELKKYRLIAFDLPGHGRSGKSKTPEESNNLFGYIEVLRGFISELKLTNYYLIGHSLGGNISLSASSELDKELKGLIIFGASPINVPLDMENAYLPNLSMGLAFKGELTEEEAQVFAKNCVLKETSTEIMNSILNTDPNARAFMGESIGLGKLKNEVEILKNMSTPVAIIHGKEDAFVNEKYISKLAIPTLWKDQIQFITDCGHTPYFEQPEIVNELIKEFVG